MPDFHPDDLLPLGRKASIVDTDVAIVRGVKFRDLPEHDEWKCGRWVWNKILGHVVGGSWPLPVTCVPDDSLPCGTVHLHLKGMFVHELKIWSEAT